MEVNVIFTLPQGYQSGRGEIVLFDLSKMLSILSQVQADGRLNLFALRYEHKSNADNYSITLPSNQDAYFLEGICTSLGLYIDCKCEIFDPTGEKEDIYEYLPLANIFALWSDMLQVISSSSALKSSPHRELLPSVNLTLCELEFQNKKLWLGTRQQKAETFFKGKYPFMATEGELKRIEINNMLTIALNVDFVVCDSDEDKPAVVFIFNRKNFEKIFNYYDLIKQHVKNKINIVDEWTFLSNPAFIQEKVETAYVYKGLSRMLDDIEYLKLIKRTKPRTLKKRLLEKCSDAFTEADFEGDKLQITKSNLGRIVKMISKGFRYNFFSDKAEE